MANKTKFQLLGGLLLIFIAFICMAVTFYLMGNKAKIYTAQINTLEAQLANSINDKAVSHMPLSDYERARAETISPQDISERAESYFSEEELNRKEGILWIDRKASKYMVTLGTIHGVMKGSYCDVFEGSTKIGSVRVDDPLFIISYVTLLDKSQDDYKENYYRVVLNQ